MAHVTIYLPDAALLRLRKAAKRGGKSLSAFVLDLIEHRQPETKWPREFVALYGSWQGPFPQPDDPPPDEVDALR